MGNDLDLPLLPSAEQIRRREFATVRRGYDPDQVRDYLHQVAAQVETLERDIRDAKMKAAAQPDPRPATESPGTPGPQVPTEPDDAYDRLAKRFASLMATADEEASKVVREAKAEAARILEQARSEADRIRVDAQARAEEARQQGTETLAKAREEADRILSGLSGRRESLVSQMQEMQSKLLSVAHDLEFAMADRDERAATARAAVTDTSPRPKDEPATPPRESPSPRTSETPAPTARQTDKPSRSREPVDPRYEDLWGSDSTVDIPDLAPLDVDFDDEGGSKR
jgi:DivIVA domain-containing protein